MRERIPPLGVRCVQRCSTVVEYGRMHGGQRSWLLAAERARVCAERRGHRRPAGLFQEPVSRSRSVTAPGPGVARSTSSAPAAPGPEFTCSLPRQPVTLSRWQAFSSSGRWRLSTSESPWPDAPTPAPRTTGTAAGSAPAFRYAPRLRRPGPRRLDRQRPRGREMHGASEHRPPVHRAGRRPHPRTTGHRPCPHIRGRPRLGRPGQAVLHHSQHRGPASFCTTLEMRLAGMKTLLAWENDTPPTSEQPMSNQRQCPDHNR